MLGFVESLIAVPLGARERLLSGMRIEVSLDSYWAIERFATSWIFTDIFLGSATRSRSCGHCSVCD